MFCPIRGNPASLIHIRLESQALVSIIFWEVISPLGVNVGYCTRSISAPKIARFSTNNG